ncbi:YciI family protein [Sinorhizobium numidicum]|uniref:YciI family protein n=1 Tax=Sinorhizobium numidicum TaxID=680248 RepID=A0ABY8CRI9_9HYPH|nr:YciI family protein [Sinorhizobium numidicum]WEX73945.1 YciI family protein [Sinorhizobium numidicum]WEX79930.1 YciI family protein [Sinorhizobium numidicum]
MKYLCLVWCEEGTFEALSKQEREELDRDSLSYDQELVRSGHMIAAEALQSPANSVVVRVRHSEMSVTDGPFAEAKEQLGGFILIEAKDLNDAIRVAAGIPLAKLGSIEVRPIYNFGKEA